MTNEPFGNSLVSRNIKIPLHTIITSNENINSKGFSIKIAKTNKERETVFRLGNGFYVEKGLLNENAIEWILQKNDYENTPFILIVQDHLINFAGAISILPNDNTNLSVKKHDAKELNLASIKMENLAQATVCEGIQNSRNISSMLFNYINNVKCKIIPQNLNEKKHSLFKYVLNIKHENLAVDYLAQLNRSNENKVGFSGSAIRMAVGL